MGAWPMTARKAAAQVTAAQAPETPPPALPSPPPPVFLPQSAGHPGYYHHGLFGDERYRSPGLAVALSLTPLPVDFGNLYAENLGWGVAYTALEVSTMVPMMWLVGGHMDHGWDGDRRWSTGERNAMFGLVSGYVAIKLVAGLHAGYAARAFNRRAGSEPMAAILPVRGGAVAAMSTRF
jgi:hypothetical protein